jgi:hypothetical protein
VWTPQPGPARPAYPGAYPDVLAVAAIGPNGPAAGSITGPGGTAAARVDVAAPGESVMSVGPGGDGHFTGSSAVFAAAFAGGAAALVRGYDPSLTAAQVSTRLETTAYRPSGRLPDPAVGYGTVDPLAAVSQRASAVSPPGSAPPVPVHVHAATHSRSPVGTVLGWTRSRRISRPIVRRRGRVSGKPIRCWPRPKAVPAAERASGAGRLLQWWFAGREGGTVLGGRRVGTSHIRVDDSGNRH